MSMTKKEKKKALKNIRKGIVDCIASLTAFLIMAFLFQLAWNYIIPQVWELPILTYWQALALKFTIRSTILIRNRCS